MAEVAEVAEVDEVVEVPGVAGLAKAVGVAEVRISRARPDDNRRGRISCSLRISVAARRALACRMCLTFFGARVRSG